MSRLRPRKATACPQSHTARKKQNVEWNQGVLEFKTCPFIQAIKLNKRMHMKHFGTVSESKNCASRA